MNVLQDISLVYMNIIGLLMFPVLLSWKNSFLRAPLLAFSTLGLGIYLFSIAGLGWTAVIMLQCLNFLGICAFFGVMLFRARLEGSFLLPTNRTLIRSFLAYTLVFFLLGFWAQHWYYTEWDEFANWDMAVRSFMVYGSKTIDVVHPSYPPGAAIPAFYFSAVSHQNEQIVMLASACLTLAGIAYALSWGEKIGKKAYAITGFLALILLYIFGFKLDTIMVDGMVGILFGALALQAISIDERSRLESVAFALTIGFFVILKDVCVFLALMCCILRFVSRSMLAEKPNLTARLSYGLKNCLPAVGSAFTVWMIWAIRNFALNVKPSHNFGALSPAAMSSVIQATMADMDNSVFKRLFQNVIKEPVYYSGISIWLIFLGLFAISILYYIYFGNRRILLCDLVMGAGGIIYLITCMILYIFVMGYFYQIAFMGFFRFVATYVIGWFLYLLCRVFSAAFQRSAKTGIQTVALLLAFAIIARMPLEFKFIFTPKQDPRWQEAISFSSAYQDMLGEDAIIQPVFQNTDHLETFMLKNLLLGKADVLVPLASFGKAENGQYQYASLVGEIADLTAEGFISFLDDEKANYVLVGQGDEYFWATYGMLFDQYDPNPDAGYQLFKKDASNLLQKIEMPSPAP